MARRIINQPAGAATSEKTEDKAEGKPGALPGGEMGAPADVVAAPPPPRRDPEELAKLPPVKFYRVVAPRQVLYGGVPTMMRPGKVVNDATHDLHTLRAQGVRLEEIPHGS